MLFSKHQNVHKTSRNIYNYDKTTWKQRKTMCSVFADLRYPKGALFSTLLWEICSDKQAKEELSAKKLICAGSNVIAY